MPRPLDNFTIRLDERVRGQLDELAERRKRFEGHVVTRAMVIREAIDELIQRELPAEPKKKRAASR